VVFKPPAKTDLSNNGLLTGCDTVTGVYNATGGLFYASKAYPLAETFNNDNYTLAKFNMSIDQLSKCSASTKGSVIEQKLFFYVFDAGFFSQTDLPKVLYQQDTNSGISASNLVEVTLATLF